MEESSDLAKFESDVGITFLDLQAMYLHEMYMSLSKVGFTSRQALKLIAHMFVEGADLENEAIFAVNDDDDEDDDDDE